MTRKLLFLCSALTLVTVASAMADRSFNEIVQPGDQPLSIDIKKGNEARITNFVQEGGTEQRGLLAVARSNGAAAFVLTATFVNAEIETQKDLFIAGPARIIVSPVPNGKLFLSYRYGEN